MSPRFKLEVQPLCCVTPCLLFVFWQCVWRLTDLFACCFNFGPVAWMDLNIWPWQARQDAPLMQQWCSFSTLKQLSDGCVCVWQENAHLMFSSKGLLIKWTNLPQIKKVHTHTHRQHGVPQDVSAPLDKHGTGGKHSSVRIGRAAPRAALNSLLFGSSGPGPRHVTRFRWTDAQSGEWNRP